MTEPRRAQIVAARIERIQAMVRAHGAAGALLATRRNFAWLTVGGLNHVVLSSEAGAVPLLITGHEAVALAPINEAARVGEEELDGLAIRVHTMPWHAELAASAGAVAGGGHLLTDADLEEALVPERSRLDPLELDRIAELGRLAVDAVDGALKALAPGDTEDDAAAAVLTNLARQGARVPVLLAAADERIERYRHPLPVGAAAHRRLMLVLVAERWGLHAAVTRIRELEPPGSELERRRQTTDHVLEAMHAATRPGATFGAVLQAAMDAYRDGGFPDEWELHHQGGSIGYQGRERIAVPGDPTPIEDEMAFAWNPSITGAKAEETMVLLSGGGRRIVTRPP